MTDGYKRFILEMMKRYIYILLAAISAFVLYGCSKEEAPLPVDKGLAGEWVLSSWNGTAPGEDFSVYMAIREDGTFDIFEKVVTPVYVRYSGTFTADGTTFSGTYNDGRPLNATYGYELGDDGNSLTMTASGSVEDLCVYTRTDIPDDVLSASEAGGTKSGTDTPRFL